MKRTTLVSLKLMSLVLLAMASAPIHAASLLLDFGPTVVASSNATMSMGHFSGAVPVAELTWNTVTADVGSGLLFSDGSAATGVAVKLGRSAIGISNAVNYTLTSPITSSALAGTYTSGIYVGTSTARDALFATGTATIFTNEIGIRVSGLAPGTYTVYIAGRNTSTGLTAPERFFCTNGASATSFTFATNTTPSADELNLGTTPGNAPNAGDAFTASFAYGDNCALLSVTLGAGDSLFLAATGIATNETRGFLNSVEIVPGSPVLTNFAGLVTRQPTSQTVYQGSTVTFTNLKYAGIPPFTFQWQSNGTNISTATNSTLVISNSTAIQSGNYTVTATDSVGPGVSSNAVVTVVPLFDTGQMTNIWNLLPGDRPYITVTNNTSGERGIAFNPATTNLLLDSQLPSNNLVVLDATTGAQKYFMNLAGVPAGAAGLNMLAVATDGTVYGGNVTSNAASASTPYILWKWADDGSNTTPSQLLSGDPGIFAGVTGLRWGDNMAVRGTGAGTQILIAPGSGTNVCMFTTSDGVNFLPAILTISNVPSGFGQFGVSFGNGDTFWAKTANQSLYLIAFDTNSNTGDVLHAYSSSNGVPNTFRFISTDPTQTWLAGVMSVSSGLSDNVRLYSITNLNDGPTLTDQELYTTQNPNTFLGTGTGSTAFGGNYLFALDSQNGIKAFLINTNFTGGLNAFTITSITPQPGPVVVLNWQSIAGHTYQLQSKTNLTDTNWSNVGATITATGTSTSATNTTSGTSQFYRVQGQ